MEGARPQGRVFLALKCQQEKDVVMVLSRGSDGEYQAHEQAGVEWLSWRVSGR